MRERAFINAHLLRYCTKEGITLTRCRPCKKNDQAHVEKCWNVIRKLIGYDRYETEEARELLETIYADRELAVNFFQLVRKLIHKERVGSKVRKIYDRAQTPFQRVLASPLVEEEVKEKLWEICRGLGPLALRRRVEQNLQKLRRLHG